MLSHVITLTTLAILIIVSPAYTTEKSTLSEKKSFTIGVEGTTFLPYSAIDNNGQYHGKLRDILDKFAAEANISFEYIPLPLNRLYTQFYNKQIDFKLPDHVTWQQEIKKQRAANITYSDPIIDYTDGVMVRPNQIGRVIAELKTLGTVTGFTPWDYMDLIAQKKITVKENPGLIGLLQQGILGRIDGIYTNISVAEYYLKNELKTPQGLLFDRRLPHTKSMYHMSTLKYPEIIHKFNKFLKK